MCNVVAGCVGGQRSAGHHEKVLQNVPPKAGSLQRAHPTGFMQPGCSLDDPLHSPFSGQIDVAAPATITTIPPFHPVLGCV